MLFDFILKQSKPDVVDDTMVVRGRQIPLAVVRNHRARRYLLRLRPDGSVRLPGLRNCGAVVEATFIPAQINFTFRQELPKNWRSIVFLRPFNFIFQRTFFGEQGKNLSVSVGEFIRRHSDINEGQFAFGIVK